ncbi:hypothetical protein SLEP1_g2888 [Rubroshorea leprosula]|uniref:Uncharacterized protein n=1 Tax=Rubroshorea leprosula TaxID=152421 RepID=A0AAV5HQX9_9ROSI|nr:hypothetical protein SLEP1_g2888 [Rubroshorea leprosula]
MKAAAGSGEMEVRIAGSRSCSRLYRQKFEERCLARAEKRRKADSNFIAGCEGAFNAQRKPAEPVAEMVSRLSRAGSSKLSRLS